jgi:hypothetical protein
LLPKGLYPTSEQRTGMVVEDPTAREQRLAFAADLVPLLLLLLPVAVLWLLRGLRSYARTSGACAPSASC